MSTPTHRRESPNAGGDDIVSVLLEAVVYAVIGVLRLAWWLVTWLVTMPLLAVTAAALAGAWLRFGRAGLITTGTILLATVVVWRVGWPGSYARHARPRLVTIARTVEYRARWPRIARRSGLVVHDWGGDRLSRVDPVRLTKVKVSGSGLQRLHLRLPAGMAPDEVTAKTDALAHALRARDARLVPDRPGRVVLELWRTDTLTKLVPPLPTPAVVDLAAVPVGRCEDGQDWTLRLAGTHLLIAGATGAGKSSILWSLLRGLTPGVHAHTVQIWAIDPKGGMELRPGKGLFTRFEDRSPEDMCTLLEDLVQVKDERARALANTGSRLHEARAGSPHIVVILDELATLTAFADRAVTRRIDTALGLLLTQGRACGITVIAAVQDPGKDIVGWRDLFPTRIAMRLDNPLQVGMVLGEHARENGAKADEISELTPGVAYLRIDGTRQTQRVRASYLTDHDITTLTTPVQAEQTPEAPVLHLIEGRDPA